MFTILPVSFIFKLLSEYPDLSSTNRKINFTVLEVTFMEVVACQIFACSAFTYLEVGSCVFHGKAASCIDYW